MRQNGFSLLELLLAMVLLGLAMTIIVQFNHNTHSQVASAGQTLRAIELGQSYLDEILSKRFDENSPLNGQQRCDETGQLACTAAANFGPETGESRASFDDVDDYHQLSEVPTNVEGNTLSNYSALWLVTVAVTYAGNSQGFTHHQQIKQITVRVTHQQTQQTIAFSAFKGNF